MRISDWSSDVCSSDLLAAPDRRASAGGLGRVPLRLRVNPSLQRRQRPHGTAVADPGPVPLAAHAGLAAGGNRGPAPPAGLLRPVGPRRRSEEHTSELQSLMRISYAVFCLKKTNTT